MERVNFNSRDNNRRPVCWSIRKNYGFSDGEKTWLPLHSRGREVNLENDVKSDKSVFAYYKKLLAYRKDSKAVRHGKFKDITCGDGYFAYTMTLDNEVVLVVCNFDKVQTIGGLPEYEYVFGNYNKIGTVNGEYAPFETRVFHKNEV